MTEDSPEDIPHMFLQVKVLIIVSNFFLFKIEFAVSTVASSLVLGDFYFTGSLYFLIASKF